MTSEELNKEINKIHSERNKAIALFRKEAETAVDTAMLERNMEIVLKAVYKRIESLYRLMALNGEKNNTDEN